MEHLGILYDLSAVFQVAVPADREKHEIRGPDLTTFVSPKLDQMDCWIASCATRSGRYTMEMEIVFFESPIFLGEKSTSTRIYQLC